MYRTKLNLTEEELMNKSWIALQLESADIPWHDYRGKKIITGGQAKSVLDKYTKNE